MLDSVFRLLGSNSFSYVLHLTNSNHMIYKTLLRLLISWDLIGYFWYWIKFFVLRLNWCMTLWWNYLNSFFFFNFIQILGNPKLVFITSLTIMLLGSILWNQTVALSFNHLMSWNISFSSFPSGVMIN